LHAPPRILLRRGAACTIRRPDEVADHRPVPRGSEPGDLIDNRTCVEPAPSLAIRIASVPNAQARVRGRGI
ncbi:MAG: hypothetical protein M1606_02665, partial [Candidatus Thermoplasmatota archaeon]|nr:hypothetical protein [Candidatus Thermoplasmatota archaeon]